MSPVHAPWDQQDLLLVAVAAVLCIAGAFATSRFFQRMISAPGSQRHAWLLLTALNSGMTIWCTHFVAMLGYHPSDPIGFNWPLTAVSLALAVGGSVLAFLIAGGAGSARSRATAGGIVLGLSIISMHYLGMLAVQTTGMMSWSWPLVALSAVFSVTGSVAALRVGRSNVSHAGNRMAALFVLAVVLLHFTGMSAMGLTHAPGMTMPQAYAAHTTLAVVVAALTLLTMGTAVIGYLIDNQSRLVANERLRQQALSDGLTGLPNRVHLNRRLSAEIARAAEQGSRLGLAVIDVDDFKEINDVRGHMVGDEVLRVLATRMSAAADARNDQIFVARIGGDEFIMLCRLAEDAARGELLEELRQVACQPIQAGSTVLVPQVSIGVAVFPDHAADADGLINNADLAMYRAKQDPVLSTVFYDPTVDEQTRLRRGLVADLRGAQDRGEMFLHYQLQASVASGATRGFEALLRWKHPQLGFVSPGEFIPLAEQSGLIVPIGEWVLRRACADAVRWEPAHRLSVNLSPVQLAEPDIVQRIAAVLTETGLPVERLELEVTETAILADRAQALRTLVAIKELGVSLALDDFGVGYSSLDALRRFPFDRIKLDRSFFSGDSHQQTVALVETVLSLSRIFGMSVLAEGIESAEQLSLLTATGCDEVQGYLFGRPQSLSDLIQSGELSQTPPPQPSRRTARSARLAA